MAGLAKLGHVAIETRDIEGSEEFYKNILNLKETNREDGRVFLRATGERHHHSLLLIEGERNRLDHVGWQTKHPEDVHEFAETIERNGREVQWVERGEETGQGEAIRFRVPSGPIFELFYEMEKPTGRGRGSRLTNRIYPIDELAPQRIDHINFGTPDPSLVERWLEETLGFKIHERVTSDGSLKHSFLSVTPKDHDIAIGDLGDRDSVYHHTAYQLYTPNDLWRFSERTYENHIEITGGPGKHGLTQSDFLHVIEPGSGHRVELYVGGYLVLDADWEPIEWTQEEMEKNDGIVMFGMPPKGGLDGPFMDCK